MSRPGRNGSYATLAKVYEILDEKVDPRLRRVEYAVIALLVATASPKLGGPTAPEAISAVLPFI